MAFVPCSHPFVALREQHRNVGWHFVSLCYSETEVVEELKQSLRYEWKPF